MALIISPGTPPVPPGMRAVTCVRCNARQNVPMDKPTFQCWQCKLEGFTRPRQQPGGPEDAREWLDRLKGDDGPDDDGPDGTK